MMDIGESARELLESLREHPRRVAVSALGVFWGTCALVIMTAWGSGFREFMRGEMSTFGRGTIFVYPGVTSSGFAGFRPGVRVRFSRADVATAERQNAQTIEAAIAEHLSGERMVVAAEGRIRRLDVNATDERYPAYRNFRIGSGRFFDRTDVDARRLVAVLGHEAAAGLFERAERAIGQTIRIQGQRFRVIGVADPKGRQYNNPRRPDNRLVLIPSTTAEAHLGFDDESVSRVLLYPRGNVGPERALADFLRVTASRAGFHPDDIDAVRWWDMTRTLGAIDLCYGGFMFFIGIAGVITLGIGGLGIANFQLATLSERVREMAVRRAIGARRRVISTQVLLESLTVSSGAAVAGALVGLAVCQSLSAIVPPASLPAPIVSAPTVIVSAIALIAVSLVAAAIPVSRAGHVEISRALRD